MLPFPYKLLDEHELRKLIREAQLTPEQEAELMKILEERRQALADALLVVEKGLLEVRRALNEKIKVPTFEVTGKPHGSGKGAGKPKGRKK